MSTTSLLLGSKVACPYSRRCSRQYIHSRHNYSECKVHRRCKFACCIALPEPRRLSVPVLLTFVILKDGCFCSVSSSSRVSKVPLFRPSNGAFPVPASWLWNTLLQNVISALLLTVFRKRLKARHCRPFPPSPVMPA